MFPTLLFQFLFYNDVLVEWWNFMSQLLYAIYAVTNDLSWEGYAVKSTMKIADKPRLSLYRKLNCLKLKQKI